MTLALSLPAVTVRAQESVVLFEIAELRPELCATLRIQLSDIASVSCRPEAEAAALSERIAGAARVVEEEQLKLAVLLERDADPALVRMVLVGARADQAVLAIERIEDRPDPDVDRSLALKVRDVLDVLAVTREVVQARDPLPAVLSEPPPPEVADDVRVLFEAGGGVSLARQRRAAGLVGVGARFLNEARFAELTAYGHLTSQLDQKVRDGHIEEREWGVALSARAGRSWQRYSVGTALDLGLVRVAARAEARDGRSGESQLTRFRAALGLDLRVRLLSGLALRFAPTVELYPVAQSFAIEERKNLELGRFRALLPLTLIVDLPVARSGDAN